MSLYTSFKTTGKKKLQEQLWKTNVHETPVIEKVIVAVGIGSLATRKWMKDFTDIEKNIMTITGQKPHLILSKKSISNFKLREDMPVMLRTTLRWKKAYDFIERIVTLVLPRLRDFQGISNKKFDGKGNYSLWFSSQASFAEINPEEITTPIGVQVTIVTSTTVDAEAKALLQSLGIIFVPTS
jgi:large subunit ribosomal protein L5